MHACAVITKYQYFKRARVQDATRYPFSWNNYRRYFEEPNLYHVWPRFDEITHPLSSCAVTSILLNFNLPMTYRKKWIISLVFGMIFGFIWEILESIVAPMGLVKITLVDTLLDFHQDFYGSALAVLLYTITMRESRVPTPTKFTL